MACTGALRNCLEGRGDLLKRHQVRPRIRIVLEPGSRITPPHEPPKPLKHLGLVCGLRRFYPRFISERAIVGKTSLRSLDDGSIRHHAAMTHRTRKDPQLNLPFLSYHVAHEW